MDNEGIGNKQERIGYFRQMIDITSIPRYFNVKNRLMRLMLYTLFGLMAADGLITKFLVLNGYATEANPFMQSWVSQELFLAIKISGAFLVTLFIWIRYNNRPRMMYLLTVAFTAFYTVVIFWNLLVFLLPLAFRS